jgi:hypothetical protein
MDQLLPKPRKVMAIMSKSYKTNSYNAKEKE